VALAMDVNVHCDRAFTWVLKQADLPDNSQLYVVHITPKKSDKPDARRFLASLKPKCMESKRLYSMASALVSYDRGTVSDGIIKFCHDKDVATLLISNKGDRQSILRLSSSITHDCLRNSSLDIMVWMDEQTRNVSSSPYIKTFEGSAPPLLRLTTWEDPSKAPPIFDENQKVKEEKKSIPHEPDYPRSSDTPYNPENNNLPLAPIADSYTVPVTDPSARKQRRKNSLKYYMYDQIAKGKNQLSRFSDDTQMEPLSP